METIKFALNVSAVAAVRAGKLRSGLFPIAATEEQIALLTAREREVLASFIWDEKGNSYSTTLFALDDQPEPTWDALVSALRLEVVARDKVASAVAADAARAVLENDVTVAAVLASPVEKLTTNTYGPGSGFECANFLDTIRIDWSDERLRSKRGEVDVYVRAVNAEARATRERIKQAEEATKALADAEEQERETRFSAAATAFLAEHGADNQNARHSEGMLPTKELVDMIRDHVFGGLLGFERYTKLTVAEINHTEECVEASPPRYTVKRATELDTEKYAQLAEIRKAAPDGATVETRKHEAYCVECSGCYIYRHSALVGVEWHGRKFSREYAL